MVIFAPVFEGFGMIVIIMIITGSKWK